MGIYYTQTSNTGSGAGTSTTVDVDSSTSRVVGDWQYILISTDGSGAISSTPSGWTLVGTTPNGKGVIVKRQYQMGDSGTTGAFVGGSLGSDWPRTVITIKSSSGTAQTIDAESSATSSSAGTFAGPSVTGSGNFWTAIALCVGVSRTTPVNNLQQYTVVNSGTDSGCYMLPVYGGGTLAAINWSSGASGVIVLAAIDDGGNPNARLPFNDLLSDEIVKRGYGASNLNRLMRDKLFARVAPLLPWRDTVQREYGGGVSLY